MPTFSQRKKLHPASKMLQVDGMDNDLRNSLWNALEHSLWKNWSHSSSYRSHDTEIKQLLEKFWMLFLKRPIDRIPDTRTPHIVREHFYSCPWNEVYDSIEFLIKHCDDVYHRDIRSRCNDFLKRECSAYRIVGVEITEISADDEIKSIEEAIASPIQTVSIHIETALTLLSDRKTPHYRNSVKESISAVEGMCKLLSGDAKATLGSAIKVLKDKQIVHPSLEKAFASLYTYTNDSGGIRHAIKDESSVSFTDAKFMLVACSAFVNYLIGKATDLQIDLKAK